MVLHADYTEEITMPNLQLISLCYNDFILNSSA